MIKQHAQMISNRKLRIAVECRIDDPNSGVGSSMLWLAHALSGSSIEDQEYTFIVHEATRNWLEPHIFGPCHLAAIPKPQPSQLKRILRGVAPVRNLWRRLRVQFADVPASDGFIESNGFDLVHFVSPTAYSTTCPAIFQPCDLQHLHYPEFFSKNDFVLREKWYRAFCEQAKFVCVQAEWTKRDIITHYNIPDEKVVVAPWGSVFDAYKDPSDEEIRDAVERYALPSQFFFYPAKTWAHKNHEVVLRALHILKREHGIAPHVFFTGSSTDRRSKLDGLAQNLGISEQIHFLGFVASTQLQAIFKTATAMLFPSKFEGFGLPILEAFQARLPVISSNATTLPEVGRDGALYFSPDSAEDLSRLMKAVLDSPELRQDLVDKGTLVLSRYSMDKTAASFQSLYRKTASLALPDHRIRDAIVA
ncbi:glycosyltransferase family 4 protein [Edaphobacter modestus]|nr:glycosyltransferase family 1 protein [Edaphobacter modestus]